MIYQTSILDAKIYHKRYKPKEYDFLHKGFFIFFDIDDFSNNFKSKILSINRFNYFSLYYKDYGFQKFDNPKEYILSILSRKKYKTDKIKKIYLLSFPRILGYVFNPVSFWLCFDNNQNLLFALAEVNNTFGERHMYICQKDGVIKSNDIISKEKKFHVSPMFDVNGYYNFQFHVSKNKIKVQINYFLNNKLNLSSYIDGKLSKFSDIKMIKNIFIYPLMSFKVIILIHYHALRLLLKGIKFNTKPSKSKENIS